MLTVAPARLSMLPPSPVIDTSLSGGGGFGGGFGTGVAQIQSITPSFTIVRFSSCCCAAKTNLAVRLSPVPTCVVPAPSQLPTRFAPPAPHHVYVPEMIKFPAPWSLEL